MTQTAMLDVRLLPWRPRRRVMDNDTLRDIDPVEMGASTGEISGFVIGLAVWVLFLVAAPLIAVFLAVALLAVELPLAIGVALVLMVIRFAGIVPWQVVIIDQVTGTEQIESYRNLLRAVSRIRSVNHDRRVRVRWAWA